MRWDERVARRLKLRDLYVLRTVTTLGSMGKAAHELAVSQPAISKAITDLEFVLGVRLLDRSRRGVEVTRYGAALLKWSAAAFDNLRQGVDEIDFLADPTGGEVRIGSTDVMRGDWSRRSSIAYPEDIHGLSLTWPRRRESHINIVICVSEMLTSFWGGLRSRWPTRIWTSESCSRIAFS
jgi:DNA-binding transcriptional LysR family regulator